jgi:hypothetical protein
MKKLFLVLMVVTLVSVSASAQLSIGAKAGLNLANFGADAEDTKVKPSFHVGGYLNLPVSESFSIQPELLFNVMGAKVSEEETYSDPDFGNITEKMQYNTSLAYISIPVLAKYSLGTFNIHAGPQIGFLASAKTKYEYTVEYDGGSDSDSGDEDIKDEVNGLDLGLTVGAGVDIGKLNLSARYYAGLGNIMKDSDDYKVTNGAFQLSIGYRLFGGN